MALLRSTGSAGFSLQAMQIGPRPAVIVPNSYTTLWRKLPLTDQPATAAYVPTLLYRQPS